MIECNNTCMSRIEHTNTFTSMEEEQEFLRNPQTTTILNSELDSTIAKINSNPDVLKSINCKVTRNELWKMLFNSIPVTHIFKYRRNAVVVYAYMPLYKKFVGLSGEAVALTTTELAAKFSIPGRCICFNITSDGTYSKQEMIKKTNVIQVPMISTSKMEVLQLIKDIGVNVEALAIVETVDPASVEFEQVGEIE